jgi:SagB-type dehydrogenase family enzyme
VFNTLRPEDHAAFPGPSEEYPGSPFLRLPPARPPEHSLGTLLEQRSSCRRFSPATIALPVFATLAWATYGMNRPGSYGGLDLPERTVPSGGGLYPLELWWLVSRVDGLVPGVYHYLPTLHGLEQLREAQLPHQFLTYLFMGQHYAADAGVIAVLAAVPSRSLEKYGDRGYRYLLLEAGHAMQNLNLAGQALGLGTCNLGGFYDDELATLCHMDVERQFPLYACAAGVPDPCAADLRIPP